MPLANIIEGINLAFKLRLATPELRALAYFFRHGQLSGSQRELLERLLSKVFVMAREHPELVLFDAPSSLAGELHVGTLSDGRKCQLKLAHLALGLLIGGATGSGKSTLLRCLAAAVFSQLNSFVGGAWLVDWAKRDFEMAIPLAAEHGLRVAIVPADMPINALQSPAGVSPRTWSAKALHILSFALGLSDTAALYLRPILLDLYARNDCPTWRELIEAVKSSPDVLESVKRPLVLKLEGIAADLPLMASTRKGYQIEDFECRVVYWPLHQLSKDMGRLVYGWARHASFTRRVEARYNLDTPNLFIMEDEAGRAYNAGSGNEALADLAAVGRSTGTALIIANQTMDLLPSLIANTNSKIIGRLASSTDSRIAADIMTLTKEQHDWQLSQPKQGQFLARLPDGTSPFPFMSLNPAAAHLSSKQREESEHVLHDELGSKVERDDAPRKSVFKLAGKPQKPKEQTPYRPSADALVVLRNCYDSPWLFMRDRAEACGLTRHRLTRAKDSLVEHGLVAEHELETTLPGARPKLLEVLDAGCAALQLAGKGWAGRPGHYLHQYAEALAGQYFRGLGFRVEFELPLGEGQFADVIATNGRERVALEVQLGTDHAVENFAKLRGRFDRVEFLCFDTPTTNRLKAQLGKDVTVNHISFYIQKLRHSQSGKGPTSQEEP